MAKTGEYPLFDLTPEGRAEVLRAVRDCSMEVERDKLSRATFIDLGSTDATDTDLHAAILLCECLEEIMIFKTKVTKDGEQELERVGFAYNTRGRKRWTRSEARAQEEAEKNKALASDAQNSPEIEELRRSESIQRREIIQLRAQLEQAQAELGRRDARETEELRELREVNAEQDREINHLKGQFEQKEAEVDELRSSIGDAEHALAKLERQKAEDETKLQQAFKSRDIMQGVLEYEREDFEQREKRARDELQEARNEIERNVEQIQKLQKDLYLR